MDKDQQPVEPHMTPEARALRRRLSESFDRAASTPEESLEHARALLEDLKRDPRYEPLPLAHLIRLRLDDDSHEPAPEPPPV